MARCDYAPTMANARPSAQNRAEVLRNLRPAEAAEFSWADGQRLDSVKKLRDIVADKIDMTARWYMSGKNGRRIFCRSARVGAMVLATLAAAQPTIAEIYREQKQIWFQPGIATIFALAAAALLLLDRFFGASTSWVRYMTAALALNDLRDEFENAWRLETATWGEQEPTVDQTKHAVSLLYGFILRVNEIVRNETEAWKAEFQSALQQVEEYAKTAPRKVEQSGLKVVITNFDKVDDAWKISVNGGAWESVMGAEKTFSLTPGQTQFVVEAMLSDPKKNVRREEIVILKASEITTVTLTLA
jgi:hypothetical protein